MLTLVWTIQVISSQMFSSQKSAEKGLNKLTAIVTAVFIVCVFLLGFGIVR